MCEKKWMLRTVGLMLAGMCVVSFVGCQGDHKENREGDTSTTTAATTMEPSASMTFATDLESTPAPLTESDDKRASTEEKDGKGNNKDNNVDSEEMSDKINNKVYNANWCGLEIADIAEAEIGNAILFGHYEQDGKINNGKESILWRVLDKQGDKLFVQSEFILDMKPFNEQQKKVTWETCSVRKWLNSEFYDRAFNEEERNRIYTTHNINPSIKLIWGYADGGEDTHDKLFLISWDELEKYYKEDDMVATIKIPEAFATKYAFERGATIYDEDHSDSTAWILRSSSLYNDGVAFVNWYYFVEDGAEVAESNGIRPAMWITNGAEDVSESVFKPAEKEPEKEYQTNPDITNEVVSFNQINADTVKRGDVITFGKYWQNDTNNDGIADKKDVKQSIQWRIIQWNKSNGEMFLMSEHGLDCKPFHTSKGPISWEDSSLRKWLNQEFFNEAFSKKEKKKLGAIKNVANHADWVTLLSFREATSVYRFNGPESYDLDRRCRATEFCKTQGAWVCFDKGRRGNCFWWTRSSVGKKMRAEVVSSAGDFVGSLWSEGYPIYMNDVAIRPVIKLTLKKEVDVHQ